jgi:hypothetical protein
MPGLPFVPVRLAPTGGDQEPRPVVESVSFAAEPDENWAALRRVQTVIADLLGAPDVEDINPDVDLRRLGFDSLMIMRLATRLLPGPVGRSSRREILGLRTARAWASHVASLIHERSA